MILQVNKEATSASSGTVRLHLELQTVKAAWGTFNMTGSVLGWSFADDLQANYVEEVSPLHSRRAESKELNMQYMLPMTPVQTTCM